jgi:hypothetical protein
MPTAPSAQIAKAAIITPQTRAIRKIDWSTNRTINSIAQPKTAKIAAAAMKSAPVQRTSSVNNIAMAGRMSETPRIVQRTGRQRPRLAARELADTVTDTLHRRYFHMRLECLQVGERTLPYGFRPDPEADVRGRSRAPGSGRLLTSREGGLGSYVQQVSTPSPLNESTLSS